MKIGPAIRGWKAHEPAIPVRFLDSFALLPRFPVCSFGQNVLFLAFLVGVGDADGEEEAVRGERERRDRRRVARELPQALLVEGVPCVDDAVASASRKGAVADKSKERA